MELVFWVSLVAVATYVGYRFHRIRVELDELREKVAAIGAPRAVCTECGEHKPVTEMIGTGRSVFGGDQWLCHGCLKDMDPS